MRLEAAADQQIGTLEGALFDVVERQSHQVQFPVLAASITIALIAYPHAPLPLIASWLLLVTTMLVYRRAALSRLARHPEISDSRRVHLAIRYSALNGIAQGAAVVFFVMLPALERTMHTLVVLGLCTGAIATTVGYRPLLLAFVLPTGGMLAVAWALISRIGEQNWIEASMAVLISLFGLILFALASAVWSMFCKSFEIRLQQVALNVKLQEALDEAEAASRAKTRFLASSSHDLRQPLHTLSLFGAALEMRPLDERSREIARNMNTALQDLAAELDSLLDISKLDAGVVRTSFATVDLGELVQRVARPYQEVAERARLQLVVRTCPGLHVNTDRMLLERVLRNLVDNAIKYTEKGSIQISTDHHAGRIRLIVADTGIGIPESEKERIFEEFFQVGNRERDRRKGLGLGLAIVRRLAGLLEIDMQLDSTPGQGTRFSLQFVPAVPVEQSATISDNADALSGLSVLVIDDEASIRQGMKTLLEAMGCDVTLASSTEESLEVLAGQAPDLVLADLRLRDDDDGVTAIAAVRRRFPGTRALLISGDTTPERLQEADAAGIRMLHKPVPVELLRRAIRTECQDLLTARGSRAQKPAPALP